MWDHSYYQPERCLASSALAMMGILIIFHLRFLPRQRIFPIPYTHWSTTKHIQLQRFRYTAIVKLSFFECVASTYLLLVSSVVAVKVLDGNTVDAPFCLKDGQGGERSGLLTGSCGPFAGVAGIANEPKALLLGGQRLGLSARFGRGFYFKLDQHVRPLHDQFHLHG